MPHRSLIGNKYKFLFCLLWIILHHGCKKDEITPPDQEKLLHLAKIIDWEAANFGKDTVPEYTVQYAGDKITALIGIYQDTLKFKYESNAQMHGSISDYITESRIIRTRRFNPYIPAGLDTCDFKSKDYDDVQALILAAEYPEYNNRTQYVFATALSNNSVKTYQGDGYNTFEGNIELSYDADGDITRIHRRTEYTANTFDYTVQVAYTTQKNKLHDVEKNLSLIDPSCRNVESYLMAGADPCANTFPFSIHYGSKCIASYTITSDQIPASTNQVSYEFNAQGYITKILINNQPFKEFKYQKQ